MVQISMKLITSLLLAGMVGFLTANFMVLDNSSISSSESYSSHQSALSSTCPPCSSSSPNTTCPTPTCPSCPSITECPPPAVCPEADKGNNPYPAGHLSVKRTKPRIIVDIFTFGHELDWLEIRLNELKEEIEYFVLVEGENTFSNKKKELIYLKNKDKFAYANDKIIHINCTNNSPGYFENEQEARKCSHTGMKLVLDKLKERNVQIENRDIIFMISDLDEIPRPTMLNKFRWFDPMPPLPGKVGYHFYYYSFHWMTGVGWSGTTIVDYETVVKNPEIIWRSYNDKTVRTTFADGGWHCSSCLTPENFKYKIQTFSHTELDTPEITDLNHLNDSIVNGKDWAFRNIYNFRATNRLGDMPKYLLMNMDKFPNLPPLNKYDKVTILEASLKYHSGADVWRIA